MRLRYLLSLAVTFLTLSNTVFSQINKMQYMAYGDSIRGFDEASHLKEALQEGLSGNTLHHYLEGQRRAYIALRYDLSEPIEQPRSSSFVPKYGKVKGGTGMTFNAPCVNEGFESGVFGSAWTIERGRNTSSQVYPTFTNNISSSPGTQAVVLGTPLSDPFVGTIPHSPLGGSMIARINNTTTGTAAAVRISQSFPVTLSNYLYDFAYWAVMENAGSHSCSQTPYMTVRIRNFTGVLQSCPNFSIVAPSSGSNGCAGIGPLTWTSLTAQGKLIRTSNGWQKFSIDLTAYIGQNVTVEVIVSHCSLTGHFGYAYFDSNCNTMNLTVNNTSTLSMPNPTVYAQGLCGNTATLTAPSGLNPYQWFGPPGSGISGTTATTIVTPISGNYTLNMSPSGICNSPMQRIVNLTFPPPTTLTASHATVCESGSPTSSTLSITGANSYTWDNGSIASSIVVSPTATTIYSVSVQSGTCIGTKTIQVNVAPNPIITINNPNPNICSGGSVTLIANGAANYTWNPGPLTGSQVVVSPVTPGNNVYTVTGLNTAGCADTETTIVSVGSSTSISVFNITGSVCANNPVTLVAATSGYSSFTWTPSNPMVTGNPGIVTPSATTNYTVMAGVGSCTNSATITVVADQGPSMTVSASPTITCPGFNATLSAVAPSAIGTLTWNPGASTGTSLIVNPLVTTVYSVTGKNANSCPRTYTINKLVAPNPVLVLSPSNPTVCNGSAITLTASGGTSYTWNPGGVSTNTILVTPSVNTTYSITVSNGSCTTSSTIMVTVIPTPTVNASASPTAICRGNFAFLSASGASNYTWQPGNSTGANTLVSPTINTTYTVTGNTAGCSMSRTLTLLVNPLPTITAVASPTAICPGFCSTLSASGAATYTYSGGTFVCPSSTTVYSVTGTSTAGCSSAAPGTVMVVVNPAPSITLTPSSASVCLGSSVNINASGATAYTWMPGNMNGSNATLSPTANTVYTVTGVNAQGCLGQNTIAVSVVPNPTVTASASPTAICRGNFAFLSASGAGTYTWLPGGSTGANTLVSPSVTTIYTVTGATGGCTDNGTVMVTVNPLPTITALASPTAVCPGFCSTLSATGASTYNFSGGTVVCPSGTTVYSVTGTSAAGCAGNSTVMVVVNPTPNIVLSASSPTVCAGNTVGISASGAASYTWMPGNVTGSNATFSPVASTVYTVTGVNAQGCLAQNTIAINVVPRPVLTASASPNMICRGNFAFLSGTGATSYTWKPTGGNGSNALVNPTVTTIFTLTGSSGGCSSTATVQVVVNPNPTITAVANPSSVCEGSCTTISVSGASSYTYLPAGPAICPSVNTTYTVTGANAAGCVNTKTLSVTVNPLPTIILSPTSNSICAGGTVNISATGAGSYTWMPGNLNGNNVNVTPSVTTTYTVTGLSVSGCTRSETITITVAPSPVVAASASPSPICPGANSTLTAIGASGYVWMPGNLNGANIVVSPTINTTYTVTGTTAGCSSTATVAVSMNTVPVIGTSASPSVVCAGSCTSLTATGGFNYTWMPGNLSGSTVSVCPAVSTVYTVSGLSAAGCAGSSTLAVNVGTIPVVAITPAGSTSICAGQSKILTASGAASYTWMPGNINTANISASPASTTVYTVTGSSSAGCTSQATVLLLVIPNPVVNAVASPSSICSGASSTLSANGAGTYTWMPGNFTGASFVVSPAASTIYTVTGSSLGCQSTATVMVNVTPSPTVTASAAPPAICIGGTVVLSASGAGSYVWNPGALSGSAVIVSPLVSTQYTVTGTTGACTGSAAVTASVNPKPVIVVNASTPSVCAGSAVTFTASGASTYSWLPGSASGPVVTFTPTANTVYTVAATSTAGCVDQKTVSITVIPQATISAAVNPPAICAGQSATLTASGAGSYTWAPGGLIGSTHVLSPSVTTVYSVSGHSLGCVAQGAFVTVTVNVQPTIILSTTAPAQTVCAGSNVQFFASGAGSYTWMPGLMTGTSISVFPSVTTIYTVTGTGIGGCTGQNTITIQVVPAPTVIATAGSPSICTGGTVMLNATGASSVTWDPGALSGANIVVSPTATTVYTATGFANGCSDASTVMVTVNPHATVSAVSNPPAVCVGDCATLTASGAASYTWYPGASTGPTVQVCPVSPTDIYTLTGATAAGCYTTRSIIVSINSLPVLSLSSISQTICAGGNAQVSVIGASNYTWMPGGITGSTVNLSPSVTTIYTVTGVNASGCSSTATMQVVVKPTPVVNVTASGTTICAGSCSTLSASGASTYVWSTGATGAAIAVCPTITTTYSVTGTTLGCSSAATVALVVNNGPALIVSASPAGICPGGSSTLSVSGATGYSWSPGSSSAPQLVVSPTVTTTYTVTGLSASGCATTSFVTVQVNPIPVINTAGSATAFCLGQPAQLVATGANSYTWQPGAATGSQVTVSPSTTTSYTVTGALGGCTASAVHVLQVNPIPVITAQASPPALCSGATTTLTASGAIGYSWTPGTGTGGTITVSPSTNTTYTVTGINNSGCTGTETVLVTVSPVPTVAVASNSATICGGNSATLTATGAANFQWLPIGQTGSSVVVSPGTTTTYTVIGSSALGCTQTVTITQSVNPTPTVNVSATNTLVCEGSSVAIAATGASNYTWMPVSITGSNIVVTVSASTIYTAIGSTNGCFSTATLQVSAFPQVTITASASNTSICTGMSTTLSATGGTSYLWQPVAQSGASISVTPTANTQYTVTGTDINGCSGMAVVNVSVLPIPLVTINASSPSVCIGSSGTLTASGATNYQWQPGNLSGQTITITPVAPTIYTVTGDNGSCSDTETISIGQLPLPVITAAASPTAVCEGLPVSLSATGGTGYIWNPGNANGTPVTVNPTVSTSYTVTGSDANGCENTAVVNVSVNPNPALVAVANPAGMCEGSLVTATLSVSGAGSYTWLPSGSNATLITETPTVTTTYTVSGTDAIGCIGTGTVMVGIYPIPTVAVSPLNTTICAGSPVTFTATGANSYTWLPSGGTSSVENVTPLANTTYTIIGDNGGVCVDTITADVFVNPLPANVSASASGTITCATPSVDLSGSSTSTNVIYNWYGPSGYTAGVQNPTGITVWGIYTLQVTDPVTGCVATATADVPTDNSIPVVTATASGSITCNSGTVTLNALHTTTNPGYSWSGPGGFTAGTQTVEITVPGDYTVTVTDQNSNCTGSAVVTVGSHTEVTITATITAATCSAGITNNDGTVLVGNFGPADRFDLVSGSTYTGSVTYTSAISIPPTGIITNNLANPIDTALYTMRIFDSLGCEKDYLLRLIPVDCVPKTLGIAKAVSSPSLNNDGSYNLTYTIVVQNFDTVALTTVVLTEDLAGVFRSPASYSLSGVPVITGNGGLLLHSTFDGSSVAQLTDSTSTLAGETSDTITFAVKVMPNGFFGPYGNSVKGTALNSDSASVDDISTEGLIPDPDDDGNPRNNSDTTVISLAPELFFGLTKEGQFKKRDNNTYDVSYTITVHNLGNDTLRDIVVTDSLFNNTIKAPASYSLSGPPVADGDLVSNSSFDGRFDIRLIDPATSKLAPGAVSRVSFTINVVPDTVTIVVNSAAGSAAGAFNGATISDISNDGDDPDSNNNGEANETQDNQPTVLKLPPIAAAETPTLFIPQGFSPDGDGINDLFVIKGLPETGENSLVVFNRWGNRVYESGDYHNTWNGYPNVSGTFGSNKLTPGTYYYIFEMKGSGQKPITGFVVLQY